MIIVPVKEGDNIERALKKFKRKTEKTGVIKELRTRQAFQKPSITNRKKMMKAVYVQQLRQREDLRGGRKAPLKNCLAWSWKKALPEGQPYLPDPPQMESGISCHLGSIGNTISA